MSDTASAPQHALTSEALNMVPAAAGTRPVADARARLPREPYPGLRPFLDFEAALLFGRERQVREVIERLRQTQFVAVLGGSGSGKSSLIHAGVVPELRSFGIPGAGDLWLPMTCTPGTNVSAEDSAARTHSPVTRLARRFGQLLKSRGSDAADAERLQEIAQIFRQEAGLARLLETYQSELAVPPGPDAADARVLFVLDQFEELFHPTNKNVEDATLLVERVLDHFFNPHPLCYVVLTMRSEHLNDCATFLELPDAINKSSYLIRRLDDDELLGAITGPAQRFLRLMARSEAARGEAGRTLPAEVVFEPDVLQRLLRDAKAITHDPDHLPLLQHLLARLWEAALEREEMDMPVPACVTQADLVRAVNAGNAVAAAPRAAGPADAVPAPALLADNTNTLRACVENWPESIYRWHDPAQQALLDSLFRRLAFKDPNTGLYSQQRVDVDACARQLGQDLTRVELRALIAEGFLGSVDYLFWDDEDPERVTLKVSHESFIRGWLRFRRLVDKESERFDEFVGVLRRCAAWVAARRDDDLLLETGEMRLLRDTAFQARLAEPGQRAAWMRFLQLDREGPRLAAAEPELDAFLAAANMRQGNRERHGKQTRVLGLALAAAALLLAPPALFSIFVQGPVTQRAELLFDASNRANVAPLSQDYAGINGAGDPLRSLLTAAELIDNARTGRGQFMSSLSERLLNGLGWVPQVRRQDAFLSKIEAQAEPPVNGKLRLLLSNALWPAAARKPNDESLGTAAVMDIDCAPGPAEPGMQGSVRGRLLVAVGRGASAASAGPVQRRAIFVPQFSGDTDTHIVLRGASYDSAGGSCQFGQTVLPIPLTIGPRVLFDAGLRYFIYSSDGSNGEVPSVTLHEIDWERVEDSSARVVQSQVRTVVTGPQAVALVSRAAGAERVAVSESWRTLGGRAWAVGDTAWRVVSPAAQRLPAAAEQEAQFLRLARAAPGSACDRIQQGWQGPPGLRPEMWEDSTHCFFITRGNADQTASAGSLTAAGLAPVAPSALREQVLVAVYERPSEDALQRLAQNPLAPIASLSQFARVSPADTEWLVGTRGAHAGWLALRGHDSNGGVRLLGVPWSTCALWRLGRSLTATAAAPGSAQVCVDR